MINGADPCEKAVNTDDARVHRVAKLGLSATVTDQQNKTVLESEHRTMKQMAR